MADLENVKDNSPNQSLITTLEDMLEAAKKGELLSMVAAYGWDNNDTSHGWILDKRTYKNMLLGELTQTAHDFTVNIEFMQRDGVLYDALQDQ